LYEAHHRREAGASARAVHVAYDLWADWYEYAFPNARDLFESYPGALREDPCDYLPVVMRDLFGNPFRPVSFAPAWRSAPAVALARQAYESRDFGALPVLADALEDADCADRDLLNHLRGPGPHYRGCWAVDQVLQQE
jgi:hypothetical protein